MCANFDGTGVFCEGGLEVHESQQFVSAQAVQATHAASTALQSNAEEFVYNPPTGKKFDARSVQLTIIFACTLATAAGLYFYNQPSSAPRDPFTRQCEQAITSLLDCLTVFNEIGVIFGKGKKPESGCEIQQFF